ncbi:hypothetical protein K438DRAFT_1783570 [Mycena galopus ATCC 62051]|nr:hypothetical protein K438DRAFT_1783570 [Mycena galopus ATCC 62051]
MSGYINNSYCSYHSMEECIDAWQSLCKWGIHAHEVDPSTLWWRPGERHRTNRYRRDTAVHSSATAERTDLEPSEERGPSEGASPQKAGSSQRANDQLNFAICGGGIVSSSAWVPVVSPNLASHLMHAVILVDAPTALLHHHLAPPPAFWQSSYVNPVRSALGAVCQFWRLGQPCPASTSRSVPWCIFQYEFTAPTSWDAAPSSWFPQSAQPLSQMPPPWDDGSRQPHWDDFFCGLSEVRALTQLLTLSRILSTSDLSTDAVTLRPRLYFIGTFIYYSVTVCLIINCVSGLVQGDALDHCYVPGYTWITLRNIKIPLGYY